MTLRKPAVAGYFYPGGAVDCRAAVLDHLQTEAAVPAVGDALKALIVPHAGYVYSGPVAGAAYRLLETCRDRIRRVILLGPNHTAPLRGIALPTQRGFASPLGAVRLATDLIKSLLDLPGVCLSDQHHEREHCLEVQLPFLQHCLPQFELLPAVVGECPPSDVAQFIAYCLADAPESTLLIISSDLSHYLPLARAREVDGNTSTLIENLEPVIRPEQACGCHAVNGLLQHAHENGLQIACVSRCTSADTAGDPDRVVGYGSYALWKGTRTLETALLELAVNAIQSTVNQKPLLSPKLAGMPAGLSEPGACFVTLKIAGRLRGCIGNLEARDPLAIAVVRNAASAASRDPRFSPVRADELPSVHVDVSVLQPARELPVDSEQALCERLARGIDGLILSEGSRRATFLPSVWESLSEPLEFVRQLKRKGGWPEDYWSDEMRVSIYQTHLYGPVSVLKPH